MQAFGNARKVWPRVALVAAFTLGAFGYLLIGFNRGLNIYDEGLSAYGAWRILAGDLPYRDFWSMYAPGQFYTLAAVFKLFGAGLLVERIWSTLIHLAVVLGTAGLARTMLSKRWGYVAGAFALLLMGVYEYYGSPVPLALLMALLSLSAVVRFFNGANARWLVAAGALAALTSFFRQDLGAYTAIAEIVALAAYFHTHARGGSWRRKATGYAGGLVGVGLVLWGALWLAAGWSWLWADLVAFPLTIYPKARALPYPGLLPAWAGFGAALDFMTKASQRWAFYFPFVVYVGTAVRLVKQWRRERATGLSASFWGTLLLLAAALLFFNVARIRSSYSHLMPTLLVSVVLFTQWIAAAVAKRSRAGWVSVLVLAGVGGFLVLQPLRADAYLLKRTLRQPPTNWYQAERAKGLYEDKPVADYDALIAAVQARTAPDERIFIGNLRHDQLFINDIVLYFLTGRRAATAYHELHPGWATTAAVQREIVADLERYGVKVVVLRDEGEVDPLSLTLPPDATVLDEYLRANYEPRERFGAYELLQRKGEP